MESKFKVCIDEFTNMCTFLLVDMSARVSGCCYASLGRATRHTVVRLSVCHSVCRQNYASAKTKR